MSGAGTGTGTGGGRSDRYSQGNGHGHGHASNPSYGNLLEGRQSYGDVRRSMRVETGHGSALGLAGGGGFEDLDESQNMLVQQQRGQRRESQREREYAY
jgi:hypothetical protein